MQTVAPLTGQDHPALSDVSASRPARAALMDITARPDLVFLRGEGSWLWDDRGRRYLDFVQGWAVNTLGHAPACIREALARQSGLLLTPSPAFHNAPAIALADLLCQHSVFDQVFFTNSGAEANEGAIKLARKWGQLHRGGAYEIITFGDAFHGRTLATMSASGKPGWDRMFAPQVAGFPKALLNDLASVQALIGRDTVAIMLEPVQGESGVHPATTAFLQGLRALCDQHGLLLIFDEVQTGVGRLGSLFGYQHFGVTPDIMTLAKGLGGGVPIGALLARQQACVFAHGDQGGPWFEATSAIGDVRGEGMLLGVELVKDRESRQPFHALGAMTTKKCFELGLSMNIRRRPERGSVWRIAPPLTASHAEIDRGVEILDRALRESLDDLGTQKARR